VHNFVYLAQRRSQEFAYELNFGEGACPRSLLLAAPLPQLSRQVLSVILVPVSQCPIKVGAIDAAALGPFEKQAHGRVREYEKSLLHIYWLRILCSVQFRENR